MEDLVDDLPPFEESTGLRQQAQALTAKYRDTVAADKPPERGAAATERFNLAQLRSCEICAAVDARGWDFLARFQYELATDRDCQADFAARSGFCCYHTAEYQGARISIWNLFWLPAPPGAGGGLASQRCPGR
ncbi:hypothetical protein ACFSKM_16350 [Ancylobacter dichloromethanicus]